VATCDELRIQFDEPVSAALHSYFLAATRLIQNYAIWPSVRFGAMPKARRTTCDELRQRRGSRLSPSDRIHRASNEELATSGARSSARTRNVAVRPKAEVQVANKRPLAPRCDTQWRCSRLQRNRARAPHP